MSKKSLTPADVAAEKDARDYRIPKARDKIRADFEQFLTQGDPTNVPCWNDLRARVLRAQRSEAEQQYRYTATLLEVVPVHLRRDINRKMQALASRLPVYEGMIRRHPASDLLTEPFEAFKSAVAELRHVLNVKSEEINLALAGKALKQSCKAVSHLELQLKQHAPQAQKAP